MVQTSVAAVDGGIRGCYAVDGQWISMDDIHRKGCGWWMLWMSISLWMVDGGFLNGCRMDAEWMVWVDGVWMAYGW